jgi:hypothetical protein
MISQQQSIARNEQREAAAALSMPRVVATLQLLLAARRVGRIAQRLERAGSEQDEIAA